MMAQLLIRLALISTIALTSYTGNTKLYSFAANLENPDFELAPTNITSNTTSPVVLTQQANTLPGWSFHGSVRYITVTNGHGHGHAIQLGQDGRINQTFKTGNYMSYVLTFTLAVDRVDCLGNKSLVAVNVSTSENYKVFGFLGLDGNRTWESRAFKFTSMDRIHLQIKKVSIGSSSNISCDPVVDSFLIKGVPSEIYYSGNLLANNGFEVGPAFPANGTNGVLLGEEPDDQESPLQLWAIMGTVKYIDSKHYRVPEGKAAIELVSGDPSGILATKTLTKDSTYKLEFTIGDANNSCIGDFTVFAQAGPVIQNFSVQSRGRGFTKRFSMQFGAFSSLTPVSLSSFNQSRTSENISCGPVIDNISLYNTQISSQIQQSCLVVSRLVFSLLFFIFA